MGDAWSCQWDGHDSWLCQTLIFGYVAGGQVEKVNWPPDCGDGDLLQADSIGSWYISIFHHHFVVMKAQEGNGPNYTSFLVAMYSLFEPKEKDEYTEEGYCRLYREF